MAYKLINAAEARPGVAIMVDGVPCITKSNDISKTGKHGHAKCRIEAISILDGKKKVFACGGHDRLDCPLIEKKRAQLLSIAENKASIMDMESFETTEIAMPAEDELRNELHEGDQVEYWTIEGARIIKRKI
ncbi:translation initiation factor IF-5A [Candidatus Pacearchaeota archaeon]|nr:translation initiation factor IF-5A [Candidatus Pacearchaeota archaeon]